nr:unnamed protein product [Spirometra erinaceieuropaei]
MKPSELAADDENASVENRWCLLRDIVQSTALAVVSRALRQHQDSFDDNDVDTSNLLAEKNRLHNAYVNRPTDDNKAAFFRGCRLLQQWLREVQDAWTARKAEDIQGYANRNERTDFVAAIKTAYSPTAKGTTPLLSADGSTLLTEKTQILQRWAGHLEASLTAPSSSPTPPSPACPKWKPTSTSISRHLSTKPSGPCNSSPEGKRLD